MTTLDTVSEARLQEVCPTLADKIHQLAVMLADEFQFRVAQGLRSWADQEALYAQGRTTPGIIVTDAPAGYSWHEFGFAVDVVPMDPQPDWNVSHPQWQRLLSVGKTLGLVEGACFKHPDTPHLQLTGTFPVTPNNEVRELFTNQGIEAVWQASGLYDPN